MSHSLWPHGLYSPQNSPGQNTWGGSLSLLRGSSQPRDQTQVSCITGDSLPAEPPGKPKNTGVDRPFFLQRIFLTQKFNQGLLHCRWIFFLPTELSGKPMNYTSIKINKFLKIGKNKNEGHSSIYLTISQYVVWWAGHSVWQIVTKARCCYCYCYPRDVMGMVRPGRTKQLMMEWIHSAREWTTALTAIVGITKENEYTLVFNTPALWFIPSSHQSSNESVVDFNLTHTLLFWESLWDIALTPDFPLFFTGLALIFKINHLKHLKYTILNISLFCLKMSSGFAIVATTTGGGAARVHSSRAAFPGTQTLGC